MDKAGEHECVYADAPCRTTIKHLTLSRVVEISAFKMSGSYLVLEEDPENTFQREEKSKAASPVLSSEFTSSERESHAATVLTYFIISLLSCIRHLNMKSNLQTFII